MFLIEPAEISLPQQVRQACVRFRRPDEIDEATVRSLLAATAAEDGEVC